MKEVEIAYTVKTLPERPELEIRKTANAWWLDKNKIYKLLAAFAAEATIPEACVFVDITERQYKYFAKLHPRIRELRRDYRNMNILRARKNVIEGLKGDKRFSLKYLEKKLPSEFGTPSRRKKIIPANSGVRTR